MTWLLILIASSNQTVYDNANMMIYHNKKVYTSSIVIQLSSKAICDQIAKEKTAGNEQYICVEGK